MTAAAVGLREAASVGSVESTVLLRKWRAALRPKAALPPYEDIALGGLGRLDDNFLVVERLTDGPFRLVRYGRGLKEWISPSAEQPLVSELPRDFSIPLTDAMVQAIERGCPVTRQAYRVRGGLVETFEFLALPLSCRWDRTLVAAHVSRQNGEFNLVETIFRSSEKGVLALAAIRDSDQSIDDFRIIAANDAVGRFLGASADDLMWRRLSDVGLSVEGRAFRRELESALGSGREHQIEMTAVTERGPAHIHIGIAATGDIVSTTWTDITEVRQREESFRVLFDGNPVPMCVYDPASLAIVAVNDAAVSHYGHPRDRFLSMSLAEIWLADERVLRAAHAITGPVLSERTWRHRRSDGDEIEVLTYTRPMALHGRACVLMAVIDVTERKQAEARIAFLAHHDALTALPNRVMFNEHLQEALLAAAHGRGTLAVLCIDLDHFKNVNDTLGHPIGDELLRAVAERLRGEVGDCGLVARLGGDEFAVIQRPLGAPDAAGRLAARLIAALSTPFEISGNEIVVGASVGVALAPADGETSEALLRNADMALYQAKADGRGAARFFEPEMDRSIRARRALEIDLRKAIAQGDFEIHYQPLVDLRSNHVKGFEALLRWRHPTRGVVYPSEFVPLAEETGLIVPIGEWVLRTVCLEAAHWPEHLRVAVNLSPTQCRSRTIVQTVVAALAHSGLAADRLELEITETVLLADTAANLGILHSLRGLGVRISLDDFGTGYSSLSYLRTFPFDKIKIDRSFVRDLTARPDCLAIVRAVIGLGQNLGITTTAEGIESEEQLNALRSEGCIEGQGFFLGRPSPAAEIERIPTELFPRSAVA